MDNSRKEYMNNESVDGYEVPVDPFGEGGEYEPCSSCQ